MQLFVHRHKFSEMFLCHTRFQAVIAGRMRAAGSIRQTQKSLAGLTCGNLWSSLPHLHDLATRYYKTDHPNFRNAYMFEWLTTNSISLTG